MIIESPRINTIKNFIGKSAYLDTVLEKEYRELVAELKCSDEDLDDYFLMVSKMPDFGNIDHDPFGEDDFDDYYADRLEENVWETME
jgi:hypothetical protein